MDPLDESRPATGEIASDPLVDALPPKTDYITYLTILEYQLTPQNLPTLTQLLRADDGTLASEIGWDLLKLVLPILSVEPSSAQGCLDVVARRGNPREVIVRVAEELEGLGSSDSDAGSGPSHLDAEEDLPTFPGEAQRVHLGDMILKGMPEPKINPEARHVHSLGNEDTYVPHTAVEELKFQGLLAMLPPLHSRIKTKFPSRFLATSLPAALGAYRRLSMNRECTVSILDILRKLGGHQRPTLPPRIPTADHARSNNSSGINNTTPASLPDPEASNEATGTSSVSPGEQAIITRLLQAVLLEVIDESSSTIAISEGSHLYMTTRLRIKQNPLTLPSYRRGQVSSLEKNEAYCDAQEIQQIFVSTAEALRFDIMKEVILLNVPEEGEGEQENEHEYPTSPSQIPLSTLGLSLLLSTRQYLSAITSTSSSSNTMTLENANHIIGLFNSVLAPSSASMFSFSPFVLDSLLALLLLLVSPSLTTVSVPQEILYDTITTLRAIFTRCLDADVRDNAHYIASRLFHSCIDRSYKISIIVEMLREPEAIRTDPVEIAQQGNLKAIAANWLKDEVYPSESSKHLLTGRELEVMNESDIRKNLDLLFPTNSIPGPRDTARSIQSSTEILFYVASLNLFCLSAAKEPHNPLHDNDTLRAKVEGMLEKLEPLRASLLAKLERAPQGEEDYALDGLNFTDVFTLDDAMSRTRDVLDVLNQS